MSDYSILAFSSQRSGRQEMEGLAHYSKGVMLDGMGHYARALECYKKFLHVCKNLNDAVIEGLCYNCMGVDCMLMVCPTGTNPQENDVGNLTQESICTLQQALEYHSQHLRLANESGSCLAHTNLGLCHGMRGDYPSAARHHQQALRIALSLQSISGQSVAVGNLGLLAMRQGDLSTANACLEQHLQLVQQLGDAQGEINAWTIMAKLA
ncbi:unnamed protein product, partial [Choristocarpus tenellus]